MKRIKVVIADDHRVVREGLRLLLQIEPGFSVCGDASDGDELLQLVRKSKPHVALVDISMPKRNGVQATLSIKEHFPQTKVLVLTMHENGEFVHQLIRAGADGYLLKDVDKGTLFAAIRAVAAGEKFFGPKVAQVMVRQFVKQAQTSRIVLEPRTNPLTKREVEILSLVVQGCTSKEIAEKLYLSIRTVNTHRTNIMHKLNIHDTAGLVRYGLQNGIVDVPA